MNIVVLSQCFFDAAQLRRLSRLGTLSLYQNTRTEALAAKRLANAQIVIANGLTTPLTKNVLKNAPRLKLLVLNSTGFDFVDTAFARLRGINIANTPGFAAGAIAEHTLALTLAVIRKIASGDKAMRKHPFAIDPAVSRHNQFLGFNLKNKNLGILGYGSIGKRVAKLGKALGMNILVHARKTNIELPAKMTRVSIKSLFKKSDVLSLHLPLNKKTEHVISIKELRLMRETVVIINTARGKLIKENDLYEFLKLHKNAGAGLDVIDNTSPRNKLLRLSNVVFSPHSAWWTKESVAQQSKTIVDSVESFVGGRPINIVN